jgi:hypothetical protein
LMAFIPSVLHNSRITSVLCCIDRTYVVFALCLVIFAVGETGAQWNTGYSGTFCFSYLLSCDL